jgi:pyruvate dehydrogenase E2 component (dihydrolipoamide acetyltransferase)
MADRNDTMSTITEVTVPDIGDFKDIPVIEILVKAGDTVKADDPLLTLESDKATMEVPAPIGGKVVDLLVGIGAKVSQGSPILHLEASQPPAEPSPVPNGTLFKPAESAKISVASPPKAQPSATVSIAPTAHVTNLTRGLAHASPSVRAFARQLGLDLLQVVGTGRNGRIQKADVLSLVKDKLQIDASATAHGASSLNLLPWPQVDFATFGDVERVALSRVRKISGPNLARNWVMIPHVTNFEEADVTKIEEFRRGINQEDTKLVAKVSMLAFLMKAAAETLKAFPEFNSSLEGEQLVLKRYYHLGFAVDTPNGLVVPVIRDVEKKGIRQIANEMASLADTARQGKLRPIEIQGGSFTISSLGGIGGTGFTPIINAPEVAILGAAKAQMKPVWDGTQFHPRLTLPLSLSWDHRVVDGAAAGRFLNHLGRLLDDFRRILL